MVIGAIIAFVSTHMSKSREFKRLDDARWDNEILNIAMNVLESCNEIRQLWMLGYPLYIADHQARNDRYVEIVRAMNGNAAKLKLISSHNVSLAVLELHRAALAEFAVGKRGEKPDANGDDYDYTKSAFERIVRAELRVKK